MDNMYKRWIFISVLFIFMNFVASEGARVLVPSSNVPSISTNNYIESLIRENVTDVPLDTVTEHIAVQKWKKAENILNKILAWMYKQILPFMLRGNEDLNLSAGCTRGLIKVLTGLKQSKFWAFKMLDAFGKLPNGISTGSINSLGDYDSCLAVNVSGHFQGQYCLVDVAPPLPERRPFVSVHSEIPEFINITHPDSIIAEFLRRGTNYYRVSFRSSVCIPSTCSKEEIQKIANKALQMLDFGFDVRVPNCDILKESVQFSSIEIAIMILLGGLFSLGVISTIVDVCLKLTSKEKDYQGDLSFPTKCFLCFSFYSNTKRLLKPDTSKDTIKIFHGMKVITILWIILIHTYLYLNYQTFSNLVDATRGHIQIAFHVILNGFLSVETFFFISGVLISYGVMKIKEEKINIGLYIFHRIWRLTPPFMLVIACVFLIPYLGSGPVWKETVVDTLTAKCRKNWWTNLLFINNFIPNKDLCLQWLWYIPVDTHLYILSLIVIIPLKKNPVLAFALNSLIFVCGIVLSITLHVYYRLTPTAIYIYNHPEDVSYFVERGYFRTYLHSSTYCIGLAVGYFIATRPSKLHIPLKINIALWLSAFTLSLAVLYGVFDWNQGNLPSMTVSVLYASTSKVVWAAAVAWVTIACMTGNGGIATTILSWPAFVPFGRLTYMTYLIHPIIHMMHVGSTRTLFRASHRTMLYLYLGNVLLSFMCAYGLSLLFESPFTALEKLILSKYILNDKNSSETSSIDATESVYKNKFKNRSFIEETGIRTIKVKQIDAAS